MTTAISKTKLQTKYHVPASNLIYSVLLEGENESNYYVRQFSRVSEKGYSLQTVGKKNIKLYDTFQEAKDYLMTRNNQWMEDAEDALVRAETALAAAHNMTVEQCAKY